MFVSSVARVSSNTCVDISHWHDAIKLLGVLNFFEACIVGPKNYLFDLHLQARIAWAGFVAFWSPGGGKARLFAVIGSPMSTTNCISKKSISVSIYHSIHQSSNSTKKLKKWALLRYLQFAKCSCTYTVSKDENFLICHCAKNTALFQFPRQ